VLWAGFAYKYFISDSGEKEQTVLVPDKFANFRLTYKEDISDNVSLIELSPKYEAHREIIKSKGGFWNGKRLWSIEVKQPDIQVVRRYTPLPLYYQQYKEGNETKALLRMIGEDVDEGRMVLIVKRYDDGEVSRYLHKLPVGSDVEIRGPYQEYRFPYSPVDEEPARGPMLDLPSRMPPEDDYPERVPKPDNIAFFAGGTGIAPILQSLLSKNPPRGKVDVYYSVRRPEEIPLKRFLLFLEKAGRASFHYYIDSENKILSANEIPSPVEPNYIRGKSQSRERRVEALMADIEKEKKLIESGDRAVTKAGTADIKPSKTVYRSIVHQVADLKRRQPEKGPALAVVCGPTGYVTYVAGKIAPEGQPQLPIGGILAKKGWTTANAFRMVN
jgi:NAD(P)H-flavin reductase